MTTTPAPPSLEPPEDLIALRRDLHAHPGLRFDVERTATIVERRLRVAGLLSTSLDHGTCCECPEGNFRKHTVF